MNIVKTRFAPSPTGLLHLGNMRTALFNALFAYHHHGIFLLRIEDSDRERSTEEFAEHLMSDLRWLGLEWQEGPQVADKHAPYYQSARSDIYAHYFTQLEQRELAYPCFCTSQELALSRKLQRTVGQAPRYAGTCAHLSASEIAKKLEQGLRPALRFRVNRGQKIEFNDLVRGTQYFLSDDIGDFIIRRTDGTPAFFFCNAIDDALMEVTHAFRGDDHLANTPRQLLILEAFNLPIPVYGHIAMVVGDDGTPLSKRNGSQSIQDLRENGWLPESILNYLARLGHTYSEDQYLPFTALVEQFAVERLGRAPAHFDLQQLQHWQHEAILHATEERLWTWMGTTVHALVPIPLRTAFVTAIRSNADMPAEALHWAQVLFTDELQLQPTAKDTITQAGSAFFQQAALILEEVAGDYTQLITRLKQSTGVKGKMLFMPLRAALTGETHGPEMANLLPLMGVTRAKKRLQDCIS